MLTTKVPVSVLVEIFAAINNDEKAREKAAEVMTEVEIRLGLDLGIIINCIEDNDVRRWALNELKVYTPDDKGEI